jgi:Zn-dependent protease/CBS domain-containing protein
MPDDVPEGHELSRTPSEPKRPSPISWSRYPWFRWFFVCRIRGTAVFGDAKLIASLLLLTWTLAETWFPSHYPGLAPSTYLALGAAGAMVFPLSLFLHELAYVAALADDGIPVGSVSLYLFGAAARPEGEPSLAPNAVAIALAGPLVTFAHAVIFAFLASRLSEGAAPAAAIAVFHFAALANYALLAVNLLPAQGLDGGRLFLIVLADSSDGLLRVMKLLPFPMLIGMWGGSVLATMALFPLWRGLYFAALWMFVAGITLRHLSVMSFVDGMMRAYLSLQPVAKFLKGDVITVPRVTSAETLAAEYCDRYPQRIFAVVDDRGLVGMLTKGSLRRLDREDWPAFTAGSIATPLSAKNSVTLRSTAYDAYVLMTRIGVPEILVVDDGRLAGSIRAVDLASVLTREGDDDEEDED